MTTAAHPLEPLLTRKSLKMRYLGSPGPDDAQLAMMLAAAVRVPDHGKLTPFRFVIIEDRGRFERVLLDAADGDEQRRKARDLANSAPCLVALLFTPVVPHKIPLSDQHLCAGAAGMQLLLAGHALGFTGNWITGWSTQTPAVRAALGAGGPHDAIAGYFFFGTPMERVVDRSRPSAAELTRRF